MARLHLQFLRRLCSFANPSTVVECRGVAAFRGFTSYNHDVVCKKVEYDEGRIGNGLARADSLGRFQFRSSIRTLTTEGGNGGKEGQDEDASHHSTKVDGGKKYSVVQIDSDGAWRTVWRNAVELGVHPRDVSILASSTPFIAQRSIITVHNEKIMVRMENVRALLSRDHALLFEARRPRSFKDRDIVGAAPSIAECEEKAADRARELFAVYMSQQARAPISHVLDAMPFHLRMMECLLDDTSTFFYQKTER